jgi:pimeloyl-ACP methyl ester carboxylesterase
MKWNTLSRHTVAACLIALSASAIAADTSPTKNALGHWHGSLQTPSGGMALELNIYQPATGPIAATLESIDQAPGQLIPISVVKIEGEDLKLTMDAITASYEGHFDAGKGEWIGNWQQGMSLPLTWSRGAIPAVPTIQGLDGTWRASLQRNGVELRLILHIVSTSRGTIAKLDSPDMGLAGLSVTDLSRTGDRVHFSVPLANVVFEGDLSKNAASFGGSWQRQGQPEAKVNFVRAPESKPAAQTTQAPVDYAIEDVTFPNPQANISLAGTLTKPRGDGPFAAAVLITGSGPQDRDETVWGHRPFAVLADYLTRNGIAVLRVDDRGVGKSGGDFTSAKTADFASDARAAVAFLARRADINAHAVGLIGHSEGGVAGPLAAVDNPAVAYIVLLAAPGTSMPELLTTQRRMAGTLQGRDAASLDAESKAIAKLYEAVASSPDQATARARVSAMLTPKAIANLALNPAAKQTIVDEFTSDWLRGLLQYDAPATLAALKVPVLALDGSLDQQVPPEENLAAIRRALAANPDATTRLLPSLNHMFQTARSGAVAEYAEIDETIAPIALQAIGEWINARFAPGASAVATRRP